MIPKPNPSLYTPLPPEPTYVVLQFYHPPNHHPYLRRTLISISLLLLIFTIVFLLFPSDPHLQLVRVKLNHVRVNSSPHLSLDLSLSLLVKVFNPDLFSLNFDSLAVTIAYRGRELGFVESNGGRVKARGSSYVNATVVVDGFEVLHDFFYLVEDVAAGKVPFDTVSLIRGEIGLFFVKIPIQAKVSCEVDVNPKDQTIVHQNCYPE
ncbi:uncharacterized protein LOC104902184 [Beta vulgaris subsp. vulgaris]|uniref:uncharacterized protein LOC104902184 n=1 Tax=Beta vulgaris subsp. vulgaris TaxID=3555 RepID=UPI0020371E28|nr:uncharacterized protein LOC104902184 [Beta vulgaris subsp. vulgaris]